MSKGDFPTQQAPIEGPCWPSIKLEYATPTVDQEYPRSGNEDLNPNWMVLKTFCRNCVGEISCHDLQKTL